MKKLFVVTLFAGAGLLASTSVYAQEAPRTEYAGQVRQGADTNPKKKRKASATDIARMQQRMSMNPNEAKHDQQMEILEARSGAATANTSFGRAAGPSRQYEKGSGGFTVRKFKDKRLGTAKQKRGQSRAGGYVTPKGKPLKHKKTKHFLFF